MIHASSRQLCCAYLLSPPPLGAGDAEGAGRHELVVGRTVAAAVVGVRDARGTADGTACRGGEGEVARVARLVLAPPPGAVRVAHPEAEPLLPLPAELANVVGAGRVVGEHDERLRDVVPDEDLRPVLAGDVHREGNLGRRDGAAGLRAVGVGGDAALVVAAASGDDGDEHERCDLLDLLEHRSVLSKALHRHGAGVQRPVVLIHISTDKII